MKYVYKKPYVRFAVRLLDGVGSIIARKRPPRKTELPKHVVFLALHQIGDVVMCLPTIDAIVSMTPDTQHTIITGDIPSQILKTNQWGSEVIPFNAAWQKVVRQQAGIKNKESRIKGSQPELISLLKKLQPDAVVVFHPDLHVNNLLNVMPIPYTFGFANAGGGFALSNPVDMPETGHQVKRDYALAHAFGKQFHIQVPAFSPPRLMVGDADIKTVTNLLDQESVDPKKMVVLHTFASAATKNWLPERWNEVVGWLHDHKLQPVIIGGKNDAITLTHPVVDLAGKLSLSETAALLQQAKLFIGIDSGPGHIAAAVGCPVISVYSSAHDPSRWAPYGDNVTILHKPVKDRAQFPYELRDIPDGVEGNPYSDQITTNDVIAAIEKML